MRSLYRNRITEEGFEVKKIIKQPNYEKQRIVALLANVPPPRDSVIYYHKVSNEKDIYDQLVDEPLSGDSVAYAVDSVTAGLTFGNFLNIEYKNKTSPYKYRQINSYGKDNHKMISQIKLTDSMQPIFIQSNGMFFPVFNLVAAGYWGWSERVARLLPFDYVLPVEARLNEINPSSNKK